jgi:LacI family transcriptional regulator
MDARIVVASQSFGARYQGLVYSQLRRMLQPGETIEECTIIRPREPDFLREHMLGLLDGSPRPAAFIGLSLRPDPQTVADFHAAGIPVVLIDEEVEGASTVACDNLAGGHLAGEHLVRTGRKAVAVVSGPPSHYNAALRVKGLAQALSEHGLSLAPELVLEAPTYVRTDGEAAMDRLRKEHRKVDAVFCAAGDTCALGVMAVAREAHMKIPEQLAIIGYDDIPLAAISDPPLSTIRQPMDAIAREAHRLVSQCREEILARPARSFVEPSLILRRSA